MSMVCCGVTARGDLQPALEALVNVDLLNPSWPPPAALSSTSFSATGRTVAEGGGESSQQPPCSIADTGAAAKQLPAGARPNVLLVAYYNRVCTSHTTSICSSLYSDERHGYGRLGICVYVISKSPGVFYHQKRVQTFFTGNPILFLECNLGADIVLRLLGHTKDLVCAFFPAGSKPPEA